MEEDKTMKKEMRESIANLAHANHHATRRGFSKVFNNMFQRGMLPGDASGLSGKKAELIYAEAYNKYKTGKYVEARDIFVALVMLDPYDFKYMFGMASSLHMMKEYDRASNIYLQSTALDPENPTPYFHASDCFFNLNLEVPAIMTLLRCVELCGNHPQFAAMKDRAEVTLNAHPIENIDITEYIEGAKERGPDARKKKETKPK
jgi:type III secretion system low calcium response chaperone LcrH/SycD